MQTPNSPARRKSLRTDSGEGRLASLWSERYAHYVERTHREENARALQLIREPDNFVCVRYSFLSAHSLSSLCVCHRFCATHPKLTFTSEWEIKMCAFDRTHWYGVTWAKWQKSKPKERKAFLPLFLSLLWLTDCCARARVCILIRTSRAESVEEGALNLPAASSPFAEKSNPLSLVKLFPVRTLTNFNYRAEIACRELRVHL